MSVLSASPPAVLGEAPAFLEALDRVSRVAPLDRPVLVIGERGTGKELIATRLHYLSGRWEGPLVTVNAAALAESVLESELFGHEAGAFTGAVARRLGRFDQADGGTLFLDEIASASLSVQEKILRVVEYGRFERLGGADTREVDVRLVAAANVDLPALAAEGRFRADLLDRLAFDVITLPPLRARAEDIPLLAERFAIAMTKELDRPLFAGFAPSARDVLAGHGWPGNVRELKNVIERAVTHLDDPDRPLVAADIVLDPFASPWRPVEPDAAPATVPAPPPPLQPAADPIDLRAHLDAEEKRLVEDALIRHAGNQRQAAPSLGLKYHQIRHLIAKHDLHPDTLVPRAPAMSDSAPDRKTTP